MTSPLAEASPTSLQDLFDRDPLSLSSSDIEHIVRALREERERWEKAEKKTKAKAQAAPVNISLEDLL